MIIHYRYLAMAMPSKNNLKKNNYLSNLLLFFFYTLMNKTAIHCHINKIVYEK